MVGGAEGGRNPALPSKNRGLPQIAECAATYGNYFKIVRPKQQRIVLRLTERTDFSRQIENDAILGAEWRPDAETRPYPENSDFSAYFTQKHTLMYARVRARQKNFPSCVDPFPAVFVEMPTKEQHYASGLFFYNV